MGDWAMSSPRQHPLHEIPRHSFAIAWDCVLHSLEAMYVSEPEVPANARLCTCDVGMAGEWSEVHQPSMKPRLVVLLSPAVGILACWPRDPGLPLSRGTGRDRGKSSIYKRKNRSFGGAKVWPLSHRNSPHSVGGGLTFLGFGTGPTSRCQSFETLGRYLAPKRTQVSLVKSWPTATNHPTATNQTTNPPFMTRTVVPQLCSRSIVEAQTHTKPKPTKPNSTPVPNSLCGYSGATRHPLSCCRWR
jgi:hypothetical protein